MISIDRLPRLPAIFLLAMLTILAGPLFLPGAAGTACAATASEVFLLLPPESVRNMTGVTRRALLEAHSRGRAGYTAPDEQGRWVQVHGDNALTLFGLNEAPVVYKIFPMLKGWQLLTICRSRQTYGPANSVELPHETFLDLVIFLVSSTDDLIRADLKDYFPEVTVLDFVTADTVKDRLAAEDLIAIAPTFADCLTCHASVEDPLALDVLTVTSINGHSCAGLMAQFKLLPLKWESDRFTKPHDRGAPPEPERPRTEPERGIYFHERGQ